MIRAPADPEKVAAMRDVFVNRPLLPSYDELSAEFAMPVSTVRKYASQEGWPGLRVAHQERQIAESNAMGTLLEVVKGDHVVSKKYLNLAIVTLDKLTLTIERLDESKSDSTNANTMNTCMFAAANLAKALHEVGIIGISKTLNQAGKEDNGRWNPQMLSQINVTVQALAAKAGEAPTVNVQSSTGSKPDSVPTTYESPPAS